MNHWIKVAFPHSWRLLLAIFIVFFATRLGLQLRDWTWENTMHVRFQFDINNGFWWGKQANYRGFFSIYEQEGSPNNGGSLRLDYAPLRLGVMTYWVDWLRDRVDDRQLITRARSASFHRPLLQFNTLMEWLCAVAAGIIAFHLSRWRSDRFWRCTWIALFAAAATWFNPVVIYNAHAWPQWDIWPMPFFLFACYCALRRWWVTAGLLLGFGSGFKGQILIVAWVLPVYALCIGDVLGTLKTAIGAVCSIGLVGLPWIISTNSTVSHTVETFDFFQRSFDFRAILWIVLQVLGAVAACILLIPRRFHSLVLAGTLAYSLWSAQYMFDGTRYWFERSYELGTVHYDLMYAGKVSNLPALLVAQYGFSVHGPSDEHGATLPFYGDVSIRDLLRIILFSTGAVCAILAGVNHARRDPRVFVALALPWALFFALPAQIHERYLLYAATCTGVFIACGFRWFLLGQVFTVIAFICTAHSAFNSNGIPPGGLANFEWDEFMMTVFLGTNPGIAWMLLAAIAIALWGLIPRGWSRLPDAATV